MRGLLGRGSLLSLLFASSVSAVTIDWTAIGDPGNACDPQPDGVGGTACFGAVAYAFRIATYEVTNAQYAEFLNAKAASDPLALYHPDMAFIGSYGGIERSGAPGSYVYTATRPNTPVNRVSLWDALRFANWVNNGQGAGDTETGSYTLLGGTPTPSNAATVTRNPGANVVIPSEDEWFKAAYFDPATPSWFFYPAGSDTQTTCSVPTPTSNHANCGGELLDLTAPGSYSGSASPYGTFDQGGNVWEWNETILGSSRGFRGGSMFTSATSLAAAARDWDAPGLHDASIGFRVVPEPAGDLPLLVGVACVLGLAGWRRGAPDRQLLRSSNRSRIAFCACSRFSAWSNTMLRSPSSTSSVISSPRCAGRQCITHASGAWRKSSAFTW